MASEAPTRSRRERPSKPALSRQWIIQVTVDIVRREGLDKATMRRVAQELDTGPASLYVYIANTAELHAAVLDDLLGTLAVSTHGDWAERTHQLLADYRTLLFSYQGLARSALIIRPSGRNATILYDNLLGLLLEGGMESSRAAWAVDLLLLYVIANAAEHASPERTGAEPEKRPDSERERITRSIIDADPTLTPHVAGHADQILAGTPTQRWDWAINALLAGFAVTPVP
ncbi:TetR/AcrR family transcriptional regulator [Microbacterium sp. MPKO10]|uniref:TetR/AcrR family transcriptional regulator n=1 Tax=Microbacterium sp. MPKO10 TaxID=2989818 RepID=UPI002235713D|nr:TetR/AcrR family transcriptional regulator [Microbacterium sp. MPKO10]MCW4457702.1 TetR/AcrR family transcriptional regulator [Microbacterium sp. MPKO10]